MGKNVSIRAGMRDQTNTNLARTGAPKRLTPPTPHSGMRTHIQHNGQRAEIHGFTETSFRALDAQGRETMASSVSAPDRFARLTPPKAAFGMRSRSHEVSPGDKGHVPDLAALGAAMLNQAVLSGSTPLRDEEDV
ncbi:MAG TPA: hypothetical protein VNZ53_04150 [Steroidobacteraceae bacterium]|jgi:hypothetical protein|nr:hypothetical protein [Steroidobacteraceae bacterium]